MYSKACLWTIPSMDHFRGLSVWKLTLCAVAMVAALRVSRNRKTEIADVTVIDYPLNLSLAELPSKYWNSMKNPLVN
jgi:hypothetical protein